MKIRAIRGLSMKIHAQSFRPDQRPGLGSIRVESHLHLSTLFDRLHHARKVNSLWKEKNQWVLR